jgi:hypothetical protein
MLNAGLFEFVVVDDWLAKMWAPILPKIKVREDLVLRAEGRIGWAMRKNSPKLARRSHRVLQPDGEVQRREPGREVSQAHQADRQQAPAEPSGSASSRPSSSSRNTAPSTASIRCCWGRRASRNRG